MRRSASLVTERSNVTAKLLTWSPFDRIHPATVASANSTGRLGSSVTVLRDSARLFEPEKSWAQTRRVAEQEEDGTDPDGDVHHEEVVLNVHPDVENDASDHRRDGRTSPAKRHSGNDQQERGQQDLRVGGPALVERVTVDAGGTRPESRAFSTTPPAIGSRSR